MNSPDVLASPRPDAEERSPSKKPGFRGIRWIICALLFFATTINYLDRMVFGILGPELQKTFGWSASDYTGIVTWFELAYAIGLLTMGRLLDWLGTRRGFSLAIIFWSAACILHATVSSIAGFSFMRFLLGLGESGNFPACVKTVAEWFPKKERALATGIFNAGSNIGAIAAPLLVPFIYVTWGWRWAFVITGSLGLVWLVFWLALYRVPEQHRRLSAQEYTFIRSDPPEPPTRYGWAQLCRRREVWAFLIARFLTDSVWRWYLYLLPLFLSQTFHLDIRQFGPPFIAIYIIADVGSVGGGWLSSHLIARGFSINTSRKVALLICALCVVPVALVTQVSHLWVAVLLVGLAAAGHQGWAANLFTTVGDMFPRQAIGSVVGIGGAAGALGAMLILKITGVVLDRTGSYTILFLIAGSAYLLALAIFQLLVPRLHERLPGSASQTP